MWKSIDILLCENEDNPISSVQGCSASGYMKEKGQYMTGDLIQEGIIMGYLMLDKVTQVCDLKVNS